MKNLLFLLSFFPLILLGQYEDQIFLFEKNLIESQEVSFREIMTFYKSHGYNLVRNQYGGTVQYDGPHNIIQFNKQETKGNKENFFIKFLYTLNNCDDEGYLETDNGKISIYKVSNSVMHAGLIGSIKQKINSEFNSIEKSLKESYSNQQYDYIGHREIFSVKDIKFDKDLIYDFMPEDTYVSKDIELVITMNYGRSTMAPIDTGVRGFEFSTFRYDIYNEDIFKGLDAFNALLKPKNKKTIPIITEGNMKFVNINIAGVTYKFLLDTGASDMLINKEIEASLISQGILSPSDYGKPKMYEIANGETIELDVATLNSIEIGGYKFYDIDIAIGKDASLLLGMSFFKKFDWQIRNHEIILNK